MVLPQPLTRRIRRSSKGKGRGVSTVERFETINGSGQRRCAISSRVQTDLTSKRSVRDQWCAGTVSFVVPNFYEPSDCFLERRPSRRSARVAQLAVVGLHLFIVQLVVFERTSKVCLRWLKYCIQRSHVQ